METHSAWPEVTQMSYSDMKSKIEGELVSEPARKVANVSACCRHIGRKSRRCPWFTSRPRAFNPVGGGGQAW
jgi:hypothetical protein